MSKATPPTIPRDVLYRVLPDGAVLVLKAKEYFRIDGISAELFLAIDGSLSIAAICRSVAKRQGLNEDQVRRHAKDFFADLTHHAVIH